MINININFQCEECSFSPYIYDLSQNEEVKYSGKRQDNNNVFSDWGKLNTAVVLYRSMYTYTGGDKIILVTNED